MFFILLWSHNSSTTPGGSNVPACPSLSLEGQLFLINDLKLAAYIYFNKFEFGFCQLSLIKSAFGNRDCWFWCRRVLSLEVLLLEQKIFNRFDTSGYLKMCFLRYLFQVKWAPVKYGRHLHPDAPYGWFQDKYRTDDWRVNEISKDFWPQFACRTHLLLLAVEFKSVAAGLSKCFEGKLSSFIISLIDAFALALSRSAFRAWSGTNGALK